jgi:hypothetical protein
LKINNICVVKRTKQRDTKQSFKHQHLRRLDEKGSEKQDEISENSFLGMKTISHDTETPKKYLRGTHFFDCGTESLDLEGIATRLKPGWDSHKGQDIFRYVYSSGFLKSSESGTEST